VVIDADPNARATEGIGLRQRLIEVGSVGRLDRGPAGDNEAPDRVFVVELPHNSPLAVLNSPRL